METCNPTSPTNLICLVVFYHSDCRDPLGMESGAIPDSSLSVSSVYSSNYAKKESRLNYHGTLSSITLIFKLPSPFICKEKS